MDEENLRDQITELEARIETLNESIARCGKISVGAKIAISAGAGWFTLVLLRILYFDATAFVAALTGVLGGIVLLGSNATTWTQTESELHAAEEQRTNLIGGLEFKVVSEQPTIH
jgi:hypothetical protein